MKKLIVFLFVLELISCGQSKLPKCSDEALFTKPPVSLSSVSYIGPIGIMAPGGGSPLPKAHTGFLLTEDNVTVKAPGNIKIKNIRETKYMISPTREGYTDYSIYYEACAEVEGHFGHISSLSNSIQDKFTNKKCTEYSTVDETVRQCEGKVSIDVVSGTVIGTAGTSPHTTVLDAGMKDSRISDYLNPSRYGDPEKGTLCPADFYVSSVKTELYGLLGDGITLITESPRCGSLDIDRNGTAQGRWTPQSSPGDGTDPAASDFFVLAPNPYAPQSQAVISTRINVLNTSSLPEYTLQNSGRLNRLPTNITVNGLVYCYDTDLTTSTFSYLIQLTSSEVLKVEKKNHSAGQSICNNPPNTWSFSSSAINLIR